MVGNNFSLREILGHTSLDMINHYLHSIGSQFTTKHSLICATGFQGLLEYLQRMRDQGNRSQLPSMVSVHGSVSLTQ